MLRRGLFVAIPAFCLTLATRAPDQAQGNLDFTVQSDGLRGTVEYALAGGGNHFVWLRDDMRIDHAYIGGQAVTLLDRGQAHERDSTRILALPDGARTGLLSITFHGGARPGLNHYLGPDFAFSDAGTTAWFPILDGQRRPYNITVRTLPGREASVSGVQTARSVAREGTTTTQVSVGYPSFPAFAAGQFAERIDGRAGAVGLGVDLSKPRDTKLAMHRLAQLMSAEQEMFGAYPFSSFRLIEIPAEAGIKANLTAGSYEGMFVIRSDYLDLRGFSLAMLGHEMAHQWWGNAVTLRGEEGDYLLDEAIAQYAAFETVERIEGPGQPGPAFARGTILPFRAACGRPRSHSLQRPGWPCAHCRTRQPRTKSRRISER